MTAERFSSLVHSSIFFCASSENTSGGTGFISVSSGFGIVWSTAGFKRVKFALQPTKSRLAASKLFRNSRITDFLRITYPFVVPQTDHKIHVVRSGLLGPLVADAQFVLGEVQASTPDLVPAKCRHAGKDHDDPNFDVVKHHTTEA